MTINFLRMFISLIKETVESLFRIIRTFWLKKYNPEILSKLKQNGIYIKENELGLEKCQSLIQEIDGLLENPNIKVWQDKEGADQRIYFAESVSEKFRELFDDVLTNRLIREYTGIKKPVGFVLVNRISYKQGNQGSGGGWHRDSPYTHQFKKIYFLNDVNEENGPFQYIVSSHTKRSVIKSYIKRAFLPGQFRFNDVEIRKYKKIAGQSEKSVVVNAGTLVLADTKGIHRGKPLESGFRYAVFCYYWRKKIPSHFDVLRQPNDIISVKKDS